jgi:hypothetical protein
MTFLWWRAPPAPHALNSLVDVPWVRQEAVIGICLLAMLVNLVWLHPKLSRVYSRRIKLARDGVSHDAPEMMVLINEMNTLRRYMVFNDFVSVVGSMIHILYLSQSLGTSVVEVLPISRGADRYTIT